MPTMSSTALPTVTRRLDRALELPGRRTCRVQDSREGLTQAHGQLFRGIAWKMALVVLLRLENKDVPKSYSTDRARTPTNISHTHHRRTTTYLCQRHNRNETDHKLDLLRPTNKVTCRPPSAPLSLLECRTHKQAQREPRPATHSSSFRTRGTSCSATERTPWPWGSPRNFVVASWQGGGAVARLRL
jgi:hypothetical protein